MMADCSQFNELLAKSARHTTSHGGIHSPDELGIDVDSNVSFAAYFLSHNPWVLMKGFNRVFAACDLNILSLK